MDSAEIIRNSFQKLKKDLDFIKEEISGLKDEIKKIKGGGNMIYNGFDKKIKLKKDTFYKDRETRKNLAEFITSTEQLSMGPYCKRFEGEFSRYQGRKYSVLFNSGSSANLALIQALLNIGLLKRGDSVGFSALTWSTNVMPLIQLGLNPIPIDVSLENLNVNSENLLGLEKKIRALFITNLLGFCGDLDKIKRICAEKKILLIEDNCESLGSELNGIKLGNFGFAGTMSFFVGHHLSTVEGGMVFTDDEELYDALLSVREHGWGRGLNKEKREFLREKHRISDFYEQYSFYNLGYNLRPTEITGFLGLEQLKHIGEIVSNRERNFQRFLRVANINEDILRLDVSHMDVVSNFAYSLVFKSGEIFERYRRKFSEKVEIRPIVAGSITEQPFFVNFIGTKEKYPNAKKIHQFGFYFPNREDLTEEEINIIVNLLRKDQDS